MSHIDPIQPSETSDEKITDREDASDGELDDTDVEGVSGAGISGGW